MHLPVKRVEINTGKQKYGTAGSASIRNSGDTHENDTAREYDKTRIHSNIVLPQGQDREKHAWPYSVDRRRWISGNLSRRAMIFDPLGRRDSGHIRGKMLKMRALRD